jgi:DNA processing protein
MEKIAKRGLLLSPCEFDTPVLRFSYEYRNKLLAALGEGTFVLGAGAKSGALITAKYAEKFQ